MKKIMILGGSELQLPAILKAKEMGYKVIVCDYYSDCVGKKVPGVIGELVSTYDCEGVLLAARKHKIDAILTLCTDYPVRTVAYVAEKMNLPGISVETAINATDKGKMRQCLKNNNVPIPKFEIAKNRNSFVKLIKSFNSKCVIKAVDNSGSRGIKMIDNPSNIEEALQAYDYCVEFSRSGDVLIEEFMEGNEVCVETLNYEGKCFPIQITDQLKKVPPYFTDSGYNQPSLLSEEIKEEIKKVAVAANLALNNSNGSSCTEIIVTNDGPKVVEIGPRLAGDYMTSHLVPLSTGVDMIEGIIKIAFGEKPNIQKRINKGSCIRYYMKPIEGKIKDIQGINEAKSVKGVTDVIMMKKIGDFAVPLRSSNDRIGLVISQGETANEAISNCDEALSKIKIIVE